MTKENKKLSAENSKKEGVTEELRKTGKDLATGLKTAQSELNKALNKIETTQLNSQQAKKELTLSKKEFKVLEDENKTLSLQVQNQQTALNTSTSSLEDFKTEVKETRKTTLKVEKEVSKLSGELSVTREDNQKLEAKVLELEKMLASPKTH